MEAELGERECVRGGEEEHVQRSCGRSGHVVKGRLWLELRVGKHLRGLTMESVLGHAQCFFPYLDSGKPRKD